MDCKCNWVESVLAIVIIIFAFTSSVASKWIVVIAAVLLLLHALVCKSCKMCSECMNGSSTMKKKGYAKKGRRG